MYKKIIVAFFLVLVYGCSDEERQLSVDSASIDNAPVSRTAIYLPGGVGIDFGKEPYRLREKTNARGHEYREAFYDLDAGFNEIDKQINSILSADGFERFVEYEDRKTLKVLYRKPSFNGALFRYTAVVEEGLKRKTKLSIWWYVNLN